MKNIFVVLLMIVACRATSQGLLRFADSIRTVYHIPELGYAVISSDSIYEMKVIGVRKINTLNKADLTDKFRIGSNTKTITSLIAALLVKEGKISWRTKFFDLFPELKGSSQTAFYSVTLLDLLSFRTRLFPYTYTNPVPQKNQFAGSEEEQRYQFAKWFFAQAPVTSHAWFHFSNLDYVAAGLMLEKVSGKTYKQLVKELGETMGIEFNFGQPNMIDTLQPWGHDSNLKPEPPGDSYKLNWLLCAGNLTMDLPNFARFIQVQLTGVRGKSLLLDSAEYNFLHYGLPGFAVGWFWRKDENGNIFSYHEGNPGTFLTRAYLFKEANKAYILFANVQSDEAENGLEVLLDEMKMRYNK